MKKILIEFQSGKMRQKSLENHEILRLLQLSQQIDKLWERTFKSCLG